MNWQYGCLTILFFRCARFRLCYCSARYDKAKIRIYSNSFEMGNFVYTVQLRSLYSYVILINKIRRLIHCLWVFCIYCFSFSQLFMVYQP